jgi:cell division protein FtsI (penicillin-binding protein 3)
MVAAPVFSDIADKVYATLPDVTPPEEGDTTVSAIPVARSGFRKDILSVYGALGIACSEKAGSGQWSVASPDATGIQLGDMHLNKYLMPQLRGMNVKDAVYILESMGMKTSIEGNGVVTSQQPEAGTRIQAGSKAYLQLSTNSKT